MRHLDKGRFYDRVAARVDWFITDNHFVYNLLKDFDNPIRKKNILPGPYPTTLVHKRVSFLDDITVMDPSGNLVTAPRRSVIHQLLPDGSVGRRYRQVRPPEGYRRVR